MKTVIEMAQEVGFTPSRQEPLFIEMLERFVELARADEHEALVDDIDWTALMRQGGLVTWGDACTLGDRVVDAIQARSNT